jgi:glyoxylase-like metal-dependent hydrolase (beta-lactamase superfamily II)/rhodanese-related sulfurtransferase
MFVQQLYTGCLAEAAYYIESEGKAAVIDPIRETKPYTDLAASRGATIQYIFETHFHADFVSGHLDLAKKTGATIVYGPTDQAAFDAHIAKDGEEFAIGKIKIRTLHTPGHTPESTCYILINEEGKEEAIFTGDTLFVGDVGRPDLLDGVIISKEEQVANLYDTITKKIMQLPDEMIVYPGHGPGSMCGKSIGKEKQSTIGHEKRTNYALQPMDRAAFAELVLKDQLPAPAYFVKNAIINRKGYDSIDEVLERNVKQLTPDAVKEELAKGAILLDARNGDDFEQSYIKGAVQVGLDGSFAVWVGTLLDIQQRLIVVAPVGRERETILRLARVGFENVAGYIPATPETWQAAGIPTDTLESISAEQFAKEVDHITVLDVRRADEYQKGHVPGAIHIPLRSLPTAYAKLDASKAYTIHCAGGYRSVIAASLLKAKGFLGIRNVYGGFDAIAQTGTAVESDAITA